MGGGDLLSVDRVAAPLVFCGVSATGKETGCPGAPGGGGEGEDHPHMAVGAAVEGEDKVRT